MKTGHGTTLPRFTWIFIPECDSLQNLDQLPDCNPGVFNAILKYGI